MKINTKQILALAIVALLTSARPATAAGVVTDGETKLLSDAEARPYFNEQLFLQQMGARILDIQMELKAMHRDQKSQAVCTCSQAQAGRQLIEAEKPQALLARP